MNFKKIVFAIMAVFFIMPAVAELKVDIVAGGSEPISIAIQKIEMGAHVIAKDAALVRDVVENDLKSSGLFRITDRNSFLEFVAMNKMPNFKNWTAIKTDVLVQSKMTSVDGSKYKIEFYVWDVNSGAQIEAMSLITTKKSVRRMAHIMADAIYERLTGEIGYFDTQIALIAETGSIDARVKRLAIMDQDGYGLRYMSDEDSFILSPNFSPSMSVILFLSYFNDDPMIWSLDMITGEQKRLGKFGGMNFSPKYSPDGKKIALSLVKDGVTNIHEYDIETKKLKQLTFGNHIDTSPSYSPDMKFMAFNSDRSGSQQIHVLDMESGKEKRITYGSGRYATPNWSPDGNFIAFTKIADDTFYVGIMNERGRNEKILAGGWFMESPSWAPGSRRIVYYETEKIMDGLERVSHLRSVDITGQNMYDIELPDGVSGSMPTWSPRLP